MDIQNAPLKYIKIGGYKVPQIPFFIDNKLGQFWTSLILPPKEFLEDFLLKKSSNKTNIKYKQECIKKILKEGVAHLYLPPLSRLLKTNWYLTKGSYLDLDSFKQSINFKIKQYTERVVNLNGTPKRELDNIDKLQICFEDITQKSLPEIYKQAIDTVNKNFKVDCEEIYLRFLGEAMEEFANLLEANMGKEIGVYELKLFRLLYTPQEMFANRILAFDLDKILDKSDIEIDRILTSGLTLGWVFELDNQYYKKDSEEIRILTERFLKVYLKAITAKIISQRLDETEKKTQQRQPERQEISFSELSYPDNNGRKTIYETLESLEPTLDEAIVKKERDNDFEKFKSSLPEKEKIIIDLTQKGYKRKEIAEEIGTTPQYVSKVLKSKEGALKENSLK